MRALIHEIDESLDAAERHAPVRKADERLHRLGPVPLAAELEEMGAAGVGDVVEHLDAGVMVLNRQEERHAEPERVGKVHVGVLEGVTPGEQRRRRRERVQGPLIRTRSVFARELEPELVGDAWGQE